MSATGAAPKEPVDGWRAKAEAINERFGPFMKIVGVVTAIEGVAAHVLAAASHVASLDYKFVLSSIGWVAAQTGLALLMLAVPRDVIRQWNKDGEWQEFDPRTPIDLGWMVGGLTLGLVFAFSFAPWPWTFPASSAFVFGFVGVVVLLALAAVGFVFAKETLARTTAPTAPEDACDGRGVALLEEAFPGLLTGRRPVHQLRVPLLDDPRQGAERAASVFRRVFRRSDECVLLIEPRGDSSELEWERAIERLTSGPLPPVPSRFEKVAPGYRRVVVARVGDLRPRGLLRRLLEPTGSGRAPIRATLVNPRRKLLLEVDREVGVTVRGSRQKIEALRDELTIGGEA